MSSANVAFFHLCLIAAMGIFAVCEQDEVPSSTASTNDESQGNCSCGGFPTTVPGSDTEPLLSQAPGLVVKCDEDGADRCKKLCHALAVATQAKGPEILCNKLKDANELRLSAFFKICQTPWEYADITADASLCCEEGKAKACPSAENAKLPWNK